MKRINPAECANSAYVFLREGEALVKLWKKQSIQFFTCYFAPCVTNLALSCELYLKAIYGLENSNRAFEKHNLSQIFDKLSEERKSAIAREYVSFQKNLALPDCLTVHDNAYVTWRYYYEYETDSQDDSNKRKLVADPPSLYYLAVALNHVYCNMKQDKDADHAG